MEFTLLARTLLLLRDNHAIVIGFSLVAAILVAECLSRTFRFPYVTGYLLSGMAFGPFALGVIDRADMQQLSVFSEIAIGIMLFELGRHLDWRWLRRERRVMVTAVLESLLIFAAVYGAFAYAGFELQAAGLLGIVGMTTSPVILLAIIGETHAEGRVSDRACVFTATNNALAMLLAVLFIPTINIIRHDHWWLYLQEPLRELFGAVIVGMAGGALLILALTWLRRRSHLQDALPQALMFGAILGTLGLAEGLHASPLLALLTMGVTCRNVGEGAAILGTNLDGLRGLFICILFVQIGAGINLTAWQDSATWVLAFLLMRTVVRMLVTASCAPLIGMNRKQGLSLGVALLPISSFAVLTVHASMSALPEMDGQVAAVAMAALSLLEVVGPFWTRWALRHTGEAASTKTAYAYG